jgi:hypothetical protein
MNSTRIIGIVLIVLGIISLAYEGIGFRTQERERVLQLGPLKVDAMVEKERRLPLPPIVGVLALAGGITLLVVAAKKGRA